MSADPLSASNSTVLTPEPSLHHQDTPADEAPQSDSPQPKPAEAAEGAAGEQDDAEGAGGAFNPVTGEINWDCPCLGGMAHGICGAQFREAFSCFVFSEKEPKGIDCVEKFKAMQDCFREHPDVYGDGESLFGSHYTICIHVLQKLWTMTTTKMKRPCRRPELLRLLPLPRSLGRTSLQLPLLQLHSASILQRARRHQHSRYPCQKYHSLDQIFRRPCFNTRSCTLLFRFS